VSQFVRYVRRYILRPFLGGIEGDDPDRVFVLAFEQVEDDSFQIGGFNVCLPVDPALLTEIINHELDGLIVALRHNRRRPIGPTSNTQQNRHSKPGAGASFLMALRYGTFSQPGACRSVII
jgi:hypothetical protein